jgi:NDP-sugar pyrophosphorylase family protein
MSNTSSPLASEQHAWSEAGFAINGTEGSARKNVEAIILAGSHAWGGCVLERVSCWPLVPVAGRPLVTHALSWFRRSGVMGANICANSDTSCVCRLLGDGSALNIELNYFEDVMPRGPAGCAADVIRSSQAELFVVTDGSIIPQIDLAELIRAHEASDAALTVVASPLGGNGLEDGLEPVGAYVFSRQILDYVSRVGYQDIKEVLIPKLRAAGASVATYLVEAQNLPQIRCAASYLTVNKWMTERVVKDQHLPEVYRSVDESRVHESVQLDESARLIGPVLIEPDCHIGPDALIVGPTSIGRGTKIDRGAVISRSSLWSHCRIGAEAILDDCVFAHRAEARPGVVLRNTVCVPMEHGRS